MKADKLIDVYNHPEKVGIFFAMSKNVDLFNLFQSLGIITPDNFHSFDIEYIYNHSGEKTLSPMLQNMFRRLIKDENGDIVVLADGRKVSWDFVLSEVNQDIVNFVIKIKFLTKWQNLVETVKLKYDILSPYHMDITDNTKEDGNSSSSYDADFEQTNNNKGTTDNNTYGFNSTEAVPSDISADDYIDSTNGKRNTKTDMSREGNTSRTITRNGNIGNRSMSELIEERRRLLQYQIMDTIYEDLDSVLTRSKYF